MSQDPADPNGFYQALSLEPGASPEEIHEAYCNLHKLWDEEGGTECTRFWAQEAYACLGDPEKRAAYDDGRKHQAPQGRSRGPGGLALSMLALALFVAFVFPGVLLPDPGPFASGDALFKASDQTHLGEVVFREENHPFPGPRAAAAYLIRHEDGSERWYPATDLERHYGPRQAQGDSARAHLD